jgi:hypothetical protein
VAKSTDEDEMTKASKAQVTIEDKETAMVDNEEDEEDEEEDVPEEEYEVDKVLDHRKDSPVNELLLLIAQQLTCRANTHVSQWY